MGNGGGGDDGVKTEATTIGGSEGDERRRVVNEVAKRVVGVRVRGLETDGRIERTTTMVAGEIRAPP